MNNQDHWKICLNQVVARVGPVDLADNPNCILRAEQSEDDQSDGYINLKVDPNANFMPELSDKDSSIILNHKASELGIPEYENMQESEEDEDGEYEEDLEEGVPYGEIDNYDLYSQQQRNNRYARPQVILETVEQESDEYRSSMGDSTNYISNPNNLFNKEKVVASKAPSMRYHSNQNDKGEVGGSVQVNNMKLNQSPELLLVKKERTEKSVHSSLESNGSKGSKSIYSKICKENYHRKGSSEVSVKLDSQKLKRGTSKGKYQTQSFVGKMPGSPRAFKDITHKMYSENLGFGGRKKSVPPPTMKAVHKSRRNAAVGEKMQQYEGENNPVGYAEINLMQEQNEESDSDSVPYDHLNSKLSRIEDAVHFFYEKMSDNYTHCINEVGNIKDYIELKSEKKSNSRMNSIYSNKGNALKTPITSNKLMEFHLSSKKKNPLDNHLEHATSQSKKYRNFRNSRDATPEMEYTQRKNGFQQFISQDEYNMKDLGKHVEVKAQPKKGLSRNNSGYGPGKIGLNRYNSLISQSTNSINQHPTRSFALHL